MDRASRRIRRRIEPAPLLVRAALLFPPDLNELSRHTRQVLCDGEWLG
jgi:hypothetical protein